MLVPTVRGIVVQLPGHRDPELNVDTFHYHYDPRFNGQSTEVLIEGDVVWAEREPSNMDIEFKSTTDAGLFIHLLYEGIGSKHACSVCPHKGRSLVKEDGSLMKRCPMHGLPNGINTEPSIDIVNIMGEVLGSCLVKDGIRVPGGVKFPIVIRKEGSSLAIQCLGIPIKYQSHSLRINDRCDLTLTVNT